MIKFTSKRVWITLGAIEIVLFVIATIAYVASMNDPNAMWNGIEFLIPLGFAFLVLLASTIYAIGFTAWQFLSSANSSNQKKIMFKRLLLVVGAIVLVSLVLHGIDMMFDFN